MFQVICLAASSSYNVVVSGSRDRTCIIWDLSRLVFVRQLRGHAAPVAAVSINELTVRGAHTHSHTHTHSYTHTHTTQTHTHKLTSHTHTLTHTIHTHTHLTPHTLTSLTHHQHTHTPHTHTHTPHSHHPHTQTSLSHTHTHTHTSHTHTHTHTPHTRAFSLCHTSYLCGHVEGVFGCVHAFVYVRVRVFAGLVGRLLQPGR